jgi:hypothetical protein
MRWSRRRTRETSQSGAGTRVAQELRIGFIEGRHVMLGAYIVAAVMYVFAAGAAYVLISFVNHLDPAEPAPQELNAEPRELPLAS